MLRILCVYYLRIRINVLRRRIVEVNRTHGKDQLLGHFFITHPRLRTRKYGAEQEIL
jgi:hypothetical protein